MSSIMRCRSGLMALSVMRDAPVLMKVANPSSQDRTPRGAIVLAVPPAAAPYRASGLVRWHQTDQSAGPDDVCSLGNSGSDRRFVKPTRLARTVPVEPVWRCPLIGVEDRK